MSVAYEPVDPATGPTGGAERHTQRTSFDPSGTCTRPRLIVIAIVAAVILVTILAATLAVRGDTNSSPNPPEPPTPQVFLLSINVSTSVISMADPMNKILYVSWAVDPKSPLPVLPGDLLALYNLSAPSDGSVAPLLPPVATNGAASGNYTFVLGSLGANLRPGLYEWRYLNSVTRRPVTNNPSGYFTVAAEEWMIIDCGPAAPQSKIQHIVLIVQENHSFDTIYGTYCKAPNGTNPACNIGPNCCEAGPDVDPNGIPWTDLTDEENANYDPNHNQACELAEQNNGRMDRFTQGAFCSDKRNFAYGNENTPGIKIYRDLARGNALCDRYFQPMAGATSGNDVFLARGFMFVDNQAFPWRAVGTFCNTGPDHNYRLPNIGDMYRACGIPFTNYAEGYDVMRDAEQSPTNPTPCPATYPPDCPGKVVTYPCTWDSSDIPSQYFESLRDRSEYIRDYDANFAQDVDAGKLGALSYVKPLGYKTEHPGSGTTITAGATFVQSVVDKIAASQKYQNNTLVIWTYDEGGGFFDHIVPPPTNPHDGQPYGVRIPTMAIGYFAKKNYVSHVTMEHGSILRFLEWNWFNRSGQLGLRDTDTNDISDLIDIEKAGGRLPQNELYPSVARRYLN